MIEIFRNPKFDFLGKKWLFIGLSWLLILAGLVSVLWKTYDRNPNTHPFNLGVDFAGGTLVMVKFKDPPDLTKLRLALEKQGIEGGKIILQPVSEQLGQGPKNEVLIRLPNLVNVERKEGESETAAKATADADVGKQKIRAALATFNPSDSQLKIDLNAIGKDNLKSELLRIDPLGLATSGATQSADTRYNEIANRIIDYREKQRGGLVSDLSEVKNLSGIDPQIGQAFETNFFAGPAAVKSAEAVSPQVGADLRNRAIYVTIVACIGMLIYVAFRFKSWGFGIGAVVAVLHDVLVTLGFFSIMQWEVNLTVIAALLTLVGYSMNDTIVIFDRIREMMRSRRRDTLETLANDAINETLSRTIITSGLTFLSVLALLVFGGQVLRSFSWTLFIGILIGTYSTMYIASPFTIWWERFWAKRVKKTQPAEKPTVHLGGVQLGTPAASAARVASPIANPKRKKNKKHSAAR